MARKHSTPEISNDPFSFPDRLLSLPVVMHATAASRASIYAWIQAGRFPKPKKLGPRRVAWRACEIQQWIADRPDGASKPLAA